MSAPSDEEPETTLLSAHALRAQLRQFAVREPSTQVLPTTSLGLGDSTIEPPTRVMARAALRTPNAAQAAAADRTQTALDLPAIIGAQLPRPHARRAEVLPVVSASEPTPASLEQGEAQTSPRSRRMRKLSLGVASTVALVLSGLAVVRGTAAPASKSGQTVAPLVPVAAIASPVATPAQPSSHDAGGSDPLEPGNVGGLRNAVDLLLSGRTRSALDAYRALAQRSPTRPELALVVELLTHELAQCTNEDGERCAR